MNKDRHTNAIQLGYRLALLARQLYSPPADFKVGLMFPIY